MLRTPADPVLDFDRQLQGLVQDLFDTLLDAPGSGLAAPQIGVGLRVFVWHLGEDDHGHLVNPTLTFPDPEDQDGPEGCLSIPGLQYDCSRRRRTVASGWNMYGEPITVDGADLLARCLQHETDHLDGVLFIDRLDPQARRQALADIRAADWANGPPLVKVSPHPTQGRAL